MLIDMWAIKMLTCVCVCDSHSCGVVIALNFCFKIKK